MTAHAHFKMETAFRKIIAFFNLKNKFMKKIIFFSVLLLLSAATFSQQTTTDAPLTKAAYMQKSKGMRTSGFIFLGIGVCCAAIAAPGNVSLDVLPFLAVGGAISALVSIPMFISAAKYKRKAMNASAYFKMEQAPKLQGSNFTTKPVPSLTLKIGL